MVIRRHFLPSKVVTRAIAQEAISSVRGGKRNRIVFSRTQGIITFRKVRAGEYPWGIKKNISPSGEQFESLTEDTLRHRKFKNIKRGPTFILRETSKNIYGGLKILEITKGRLRASSTIGWTGKAAELVAMFEAGFSPLDTSWFGHDPPDGFSEIQVAPRRVRGFQPAFRENLYMIMQDFLNFSR